MAGILMRLLSVLLFVSFVFFSAILGEGVFGHILFYGLLVSFITNGDGRWGRPVCPGQAREDRHPRRLQSLLGEFKNDTVTLIARRDSSTVLRPRKPEPGSLVLLS
jgi:hypothetical protein